MTASDHASLDRFNRSLDEAFSGRDASLIDEDAGLTWAIQHLRSLDDSFALSPGLKDQMWRTVMNYPSIAQPERPSINRMRTNVLNGRASVHGSKQAAHRPAQGRRWWPGAELATAAVLVLALVTGYAAYRLALPSSHAGTPNWQTSQSGALYVTDLKEDAGSWEFRPIDPTTLADLQDQPSVSLDWNSVISADGSTMVTIDYDIEPLDDEAIATSEADPNAASGPSPEDVWLIVHDGRTGEESIRFQPPAPVTFPRLSQDGSRLVVMRDPDFDPDSGTFRPAPRKPAEWYVFDTVDGSLLATARAERVEHGRYHAWIDPAAQRLYYLPVVGSSADATPQLLRLYAYDLTTGGEIGRLDLPGILAGNWRSDGPSDDELMLSTFEPGVALSPDGRRLAIVHTDGAVLTLVATESLAVERTVQLSHQTGWRETILGLLPLMPRDAAAKTTEGTTLHAVFSPDGTRLYVFGIRAEVDESGEQVWRDLGLQVIDVASGDIVADALADTRIDVVLPTPDGQSLFVLGPSDPAALMGDGDDIIYVLRRLDASSLETMAEREFDGFRMIMLWPTASWDD